jgi:hypothetical protein
MNVEILYRPSFLLAKVALTAGESIQTELSGCLD